MSKSLSHIPGNLGLPFIGSTVRAMRDPIGLVRDKYKKFGMVYKARSVYMTSVSMLGPDAAQFVLQNKDRIFSNTMGWKPNLGLLFPNSLMLQDFDEHKAHRQIMLDAFKRPAIERYASLMSAEYQREIERWGDGGPIDIYARIKNLFLNIGVSLFFGQDLGVDATWVNESMSTMTSASTAFVRRPIIGLGYWKGIKAREKLANYIRKRIPLVRGLGADSMLSKLCNAKDEHDNYFSDEQIIDHMLFIIMAAHDTTTSAATSMLVELSRSRIWQQNVRIETSRLPRTESYLEDINAQVELDKVFKECLRLYPPVPALPRYTLREVNFGGYLIPSNTSVWVFPYFNHRNEEYWSNPDSFDPDRFSEERAEDKQHKFLFVPFGGGVHTCIGLHLAGIMVKLFIRDIITNFVVTLPSNQEVKFKMFPFPKPTGQLILNATKIPS
jgi:cytochrome P450